MINISIRLYYIYSQSTEQPIKANRLSQPIKANRLSQPIKANRLSQPIKASLFTVNRLS